MDKMEFFFEEDGVGSNGVNIETKCYQLRVESAHIYLFLAFSIRKILMYFVAQQH